jgi:hypothetical protein
MIDKRPAAIAVCKSDKNVVDVVNFARENHIETSIRSGGHSGAGLALIDNGLVIDLSKLNNIQIDPTNKTGVIQPGCLLKDVDAATHEFGLALPSGIIGTTGIGGLTLGGGIGYLSRKAGLTIDNLIECKVVLASGELVTANKESHPDLFWALRGGGGNFGVVTSFKFKLLDIKNVYAGPMFWPIETAKETMKFYDKLTKNASNDLYGFFAFLTVPPAAPFPEHLWNQKVCGVVWNYTGPIEKAEEIFKPIREFGPPILDFVSEIPLPALNSMFDGLYPPGMQWYWRAHYIKELTTESIKYSKADKSRTEKIIDISPEGEINFNFNYFCIDKNETEAHKNLNYNTFAEASGALCCHIRLTVLLLVCIAVAVSCWRMKWALENHCRLCFLLHTSSLNGHCL